MNGSISAPAANDFEEPHRLLEDGVFRFPESSGQDRGAASRQIVMSPQRPFMPYTLLVWGAKADTVFRAITIAGDNLLRSKVPGSLFEAEIPFDEFESLLLRRPDIHPAIVDLDTLGHFFRFDMPAVECGSSIHVEVEGCFDQAVFIGQMPRVDYPPRAVA